MPDKKENNQPKQEDPEVEPETKDSNDDPTPIDAAIEEIVQEESDTALEAEDNKEIDTPKLKKRFYKKKKFWVPLSVLLVLIIAFCLPTSRYSILGLFIKQHYLVEVVDVQTNSPVTAADVSIDGKTVVTDAQGNATIDVKVGKATLGISKNYYAGYKKSVLVPIKVHGRVTFSLQATGRQVPIVLVNKISGAAVSNADVSASGSEVKTDSSGKAIIVLPANKSTVAATITAQGFNTQSATIQVSSQALAANNFQITPSGSVYFLSNATGTINVDKINLDGTNSQIVISGTGNEDPNDTSIVTSNDAKYIALIAQRTGSSPDLYIINTSTDKLITVDSGGANYMINGWTPSDYLVYTVDKAGISSGQPGTSALKTYYPDSDQVTTLDETDSKTSSDSSTNIVQSYDAVNVLSNNNILFLKSWQGDVSTFTGLQITLSSVLPNGSSNNVVQSFPLTTYFPGANAVSAGPSSVYYYLNSLNSTDTSTDFEYTNQKLEQISGSNVGAATLAQTNPINYFLSPSGDHTAWSAQINGHSAIIVGDNTASNQKQVAILDNTYNVYGWYSENYLLISKNSNELYIMPVSGVSNVDQLVKITNYL